MAGEPITLAEMVELFGETMPIEAVALLQKAPDGMTIGELRDELRRIAKDAMGWQNMDTAPRDGTPIQAEIEGEGTDFVIMWQGGFVGENGEDCATWVIADEQEPPACWTDGVCWDSNENEVPSARPIRWKHLN